VLSNDDPYPFRCPNAAHGDDVDHVVTRVLEATGDRWSELVDDDPNPFIRYRRLFHSWHVAIRHGMADDAYVDLVCQLDKEVARVDGKGFEVTPFGRAAELSGRLGFAQDGGLWVKDETGNVSGSHKARHMMGLLIHLALVERLGLATDGESRELAIASCGNAALAAAVVARAGGRPLQVFVPTWGDEFVVARLKELGASVNTVPREEGVPGDPTYLALQRAIGNGALPFTCQGTENGLAIEGGMTIGYELASQLSEERTAIDRLVIQVGGGALASSVLQGLSEAAELGALERLPRVDTVQTQGGHPLQRAYERLTARIAARLAAGDGIGSDVALDLAQRFDAPEVQEELAFARTHRSKFMWPWEEEPRSIAHGILDDETYDWFVVVRGMLRTGGRPLVVDEEALKEANELARAATGIDVDPTGSAGLAGVLVSGFERNERIAVLFTGHIREGEG
jgi:threonine synthase